mmetsp:Transcript_19505/g.26784  ORF Transcript_19505/g.26784 Transcript_19505/m.26784 type:complete len:155 (-) Transcript_19505:555-1019(-)|eukprot:CAMPEP_0170069838 /NCGR_PEP_ID=MMETSP0019_2-20121128/8361_1 /TAXON_ID=98059 /ORGANISM="Dinobryon sp., Strain UTEXLB2267" /LENGTH=154 /DNA_ID=CAMNT_0010277979 /DNA_START=706 /DNA_END=1170 /DNA_ORIENTATION=-
MTLKPRSFPRNTCKKCSSQLALRHLITPNKLLGGKGVEWENELRSIDHRRSRGRAAPTVSRFHLVAEYLADVEILSATDVFIGSYSNVYAIVAAKRMSGQMYFPRNQTCMFDLVSKDVDQHCESSTDTIKFWSSKFMDMKWSNIQDGITYWPKE